MTLDAQSNNHAQECYRLARTAYDALPWDQKLTVAKCPECGASWVCVHPRLNLWRKQGPGV